MDFKLDTRDIQIILTLQKFQVNNSRTSQVEVSRSLGISIATVERRINKFKKQGFLKVTREGSKVYNYRFTKECPFGFSPEEDEPSFSGESDPSQHLKPSLQTTGESANPSKEIMFSQLVARSASSFAEQKMFSASYPDYINKEVIYPMYSLKRLYVVENGRKEVSMGITFIGSGSLKDSLEASFKDRKRPVKKEKFDLISETPPKLEQEKKISQIEKNSDCNSTDIWYIWVEEWKNKGWKSKPSAWTLREKKHIKDLLREYGSDEIIEYVRYCIKNWADLSSRFRITSAVPTVPIIYGYRSSWIPECVDKIKSSPLPKSRKDREYKHEDGLSIPSGSWGRKKEVNV